jgi:hypothetical protein
MVIKRKISIEKYIIAAVITFFVFMSGVLLGLLMDNARANVSEQKTKEQEVSYNSIQFQYLLLSELQRKEEVCPVISIALQEAVKELSKSLDEFQQYEKDSRSSKETFELIHRKYVLDNLRYWLLASKSKSLCNMQILPILYFYSTKTCQICPDQGTALTYYKKKFGDTVLIFPIDFDMAEKETTIEILRARYNVTKFPTLIIDNEKYEGLIETKDLGNIICSKLKANPLCKKSS